MVSKGKNEKNKSILKIVPDKIKSSKKAKSKSKVKSKSVVKAKTEKKSKKKLRFNLSGVVPLTGKEEHSGLRSQVLKMRETIDTARWELAECLFEVHDCATFSHWGYPSWDSYIDNEVGMSIRTAQYLTAMYHYFQIDLVSDVRELEDNDSEKMEAEQVKEHIIDEVKLLGWTKAKSLVSVIDRENYKEWIEKAKKMTSKELSLAAKSFLKGPSGGGDEEGFKRVSFLLAPEQKETVNGAVKLCGENSGSDKPGNCMTLICQDYVAGNMALTKGEKAFSGYLDKTGAVLDVRLIAVCKQSGKVVHNSKLFSKMVDSQENK